jgi:hypothetical protein
VAGSGKHPDAIDYLETLTSNMTERQISAAQAFALKWTHEHPRDPEKTLDHTAYKPD